MANSTEHTLRNCRILLVDDDEFILDMLTITLEQYGCQIMVAGDGQQALRALARQPVDIVISDMEMPIMNGEQLLREIAVQYPETIRVLLTGSSGLSNIIAAVNHGHIWGYMQKPVDVLQLVILLEQAIYIHQGISERSLLRFTLEHYQCVQKNNFEGFIGNSMNMRFVYKAIEQSAPSNASVFITGPSGTGKELVAQAIHQRSKRSNKACVIINCAAIPQELMESEIFGHTKGAFTGAQSSRDGAASRADGGTLFFDELGEMNMVLQAKLLRFIQTGEYQPVGSDKIHTANIRFICATNRDPLEAIAQKRLREDLYYRLNVVSIHLPSLHERDDDVLLLAQHFLKVFSEQEGKNFIGITRTAEIFLLSYSWPGNVRQLQNCIHYCVVMSPGPLLTKETLKEALQLSVSHLLLAVPISELEQDTDQTQPDSALAATIEEIQSLAEVERGAITSALVQTNNNVVEAASALGLSPSTLYRKLALWEK